MGRSSAMDSTDGERMLALLVVAADLAIWTLVIPTRALVDLLPV